MEIDPIELKETADGAAEAKSFLNAMVAVTIALLATFLGICKVKDDNIVQAMQQAQADKLDHWAYYQAKNTQSKVLSVGAEQLEVMSLSFTGAAKAKAESSSKTMRAKSKDEDSKKEEYGKKAKDDEDTYNKLNTHDDQFDLSDALLAISISLLAVTALTQKRWLFWLALVPTFFGILMGLAGLLGWGLHPDAITNLLSTIWEVPSIGT